MVILPFSLLTAFLALMLKLTLNLSAFVLALPMLYIFGCGLYTLYCGGMGAVPDSFCGRVRVLFAHRGRNGACGSRRAIQRMAYGTVMEETMDKDKMLDYFNDREATLFRDELGKQCTVSRTPAEKTGSGRRTPENGGRSSMEAVSSAG